MEVMKDLHESDQFPVLLKKIDEILHNGVTPWKTERANWNLYQNFAHVQIPR